MQPQVDIRIIPMVRNPQVCENGDRLHVAPKPIAIYKSGHRCSSRCCKQLRSQLRFGTPVTWPGPMLRRRYTNVFLTSLSPLSHSCDCWSPPLNSQHVASVFHEWSTINNIKRHVSTLIAVTSFMEDRASSNTDLRKRNSWQRLVEHLPHFCE